PLYFQQHFFFVPRENLLEHFQQVKQSNRNLRVVLIGFDFSTFENGALNRCSRPQHLGGRFVLLVFEQLIDEVLARILFFFRRRGSMPRQQHLCFQIDECCRHHQKTTGGNNIKL